MATTALLSENAQRTTTSAGTQFLVKWRELNDFSSVKNHAKWLVAHNIVCSNFFTIVQLLKSCALRIKRINFPSKTDYDHGEYMGDDDDEYDDGEFDDEEMEFEDEEEEEDEYVESEPDNASEPEPYMQG